MSGETRTERARTVTRHLGWLEGPRLDAVVAALSVLMVAGVAWDFRSHAEGISFADEGFFTASHVFFYSMFLGIAVVIAVATYRNRLAGASWIDAVPAGYQWGVVGVLVFGFGGVADFGWHSTFGFEESFEALTSPSHLLLGTGAVLFLASPLRATWRRDDDATGVSLVPALLSGSLALSMLALFTAYSNPVLNPTATPGFGPSSAGSDIAAFIVFPALLVGTALVLARRFDLPVGALALVFLPPALVSAATSDRFELAVPVVLAGLVGDALVRWRRPTAANPRALRTFGAIVPAVFAAGYFAVLAATTGVTWSVHVWPGAVVIAGFAGLLLTYVVVPDAAAAEA